jgi:hypothetical protein
MRGLISPLTLLAVTMDTAGRGGKLPLLTLC